MSVRFDAWDSKERTGPLITFLPRPSPGVIPESINATSPPLPVHPFCHISMSFVFFATFNQEPGYLFGSTPSTVPSRCTPASGVTDRTPGVRRSASIRSLGSSAMKASIVLSRRVTMPPSDATASSASAMKTLDALTITVMVGGGGAALPGPLDKAATMLSPATAARTRRDMGRSSDADLDSKLPAPLLQSG